MSDPLDMTLKEITFIFDLPFYLEKLQSVLEEQLKNLGLPFITTSSKAFDQDKRDASQSSTSIIITQGWLESQFKFPLRLGQFNDYVSYLCSGRENLIETSASLDLGKYLLNTNENTLVCKYGNFKIRLTDKEHLFLRALYHAPNHIKSRDSLLKEVWGYILGTETHTIETHLYRLRQKLEPYSAETLIRADGQGNYFLDM